MLVALPETRKSTLSVLTACRSVRGPAQRLLDALETVPGDLTALLTVYGHPGHSHGERSRSQLLFELAYTDTAAVTRWLLNRVLC